ncbi:MAG: hypothetical protein WAN47_04255 [Nitrosotalea sp.]
MINLGTAKLSGIMLVGILAIAGTDLAFAQNATSTTPPACGSMPYAFVACSTTTGTAQMEGFIMVGAVVAFSVGCGAAGLKYRSYP